MALVTGVTLPNNGDRIKVENYNDPITKILAQVNGGLDSANITAASLPWEVMAPFTNKIPSAGMQDNGNLAKYRSESSLSHIASGGIWSALSGLNAAMTAAVQYSTSGERLSIAAVASRAFTASKDTYVSLSPTGVLTYTEVANGAAQPTITAGHMWVAKVVTSGVAVTSVTDMRQTAVIKSANVDFSSFGLVDANGWSDYGLFYMKRFSHTNATSIAANGSIYVDTAASAGNGPVAEAGAFPSARTIAIVAHNTGTVPNSGVIATLDSTYAKGFFAFNAGSSAGAWGTRLVTMLVFKV